jgi:phenylpropionate dioxygenase-like ring-hydroxylating dioxygenase large terminal subunit
MESKNLTAPHVCNAAKNVDRLSELTSRTTVTLFRRDVEMVENCQHRLDGEQSPGYGMSVDLSFEHVRAAKGNPQF